MSVLKSITTNKGLITAASGGTVDTADVTDRAVTDAKLRDSSATSAVGRAGATNGQPGDIIASADGQVLRRSGTTLGFGTVATAGLADDGVTNAKLRNSGACSVLGRSANSTGDPADISSSADGEYLQRVAGVLSFAATITATNDESTASFTTFNLLAGGLSNGTWYDSDGTANMPSLTLSTAGTYLVYGYGRVVLQANAGQAGNIAFRLYNSTDSAAVTNSESMGLLNDTGSRIDATAMVMTRVTVAGSKTIKLQAKRDNATTWTLAQVSSDANGRTKVGCVKISP